MPLPGSQIIQRTVALVRKAAQSLTSVYSSGWTNWWGWGSGWIQEPFSGAWQRNMSQPDNEADILAFSAVYACVTGIASDVAKMRIKLDRVTADGIWEEITSNQPWLPLLRRPNHYQTRGQFVRCWIISKLLYGNTYVLKGRDQRGVVNAMYVLDARRVKPLVAENSDVYYELQADYLSGLEEIVTVPAREIIHDRMPEFFHPLVGISPIYACSKSATMGNRIQSQSTSLFANGGRPGGIIYVPGTITNEAATALKTLWEANYGGVNSGRTAVLGDGLKFEDQVMNSVDAQLIEQLKWTVEDVGRTFHYPQWKLNSGSMPPYSSGPEALTIMYYTDCLHPLIESIEDCLDDGLELPLDMHVELDLDNLLRMDTSALFESNQKAVNGGWMKPDEARFRANLAPVAGGDTPYLQVQNYSLAALAKRDAKADPFGTTPAPQPQLPPADKPALPPAPAKAFDFEDLEHCEKVFREELILEQA